MKFVDWYEILTCLDLEEAVQRFTTILNNIYNKHAPWIVYQTRKQYCPWITYQLKTLMKERDVLKWNIKEAKLNRSHNLEEIQQMHNNFKYIRNKINNFKKTDEETYKKKKLE